MNDIKFTPNAWQEYLDIQAKDKKMLSKINSLIKDILRNPFSGLGKPEQLSGNLSGCWSRRVDDKNRIVYSLSNDSITILQCETHYKEK